MNSAADDQRTGSDQHDIAMDDFIVTKGGATCWHYEKTPFTSEIAAVAERELKEKPVERDAAVEKFRQRIIEKADFKSRLDELFLLRFLRARKYDEDRAFRLLRNYYWAFGKYTDIFGDVRPSVIEDKIMQFSTAILPYRDPEGRVIFVAKLSEWVNDRTPFNIGIRIVGMSEEVVIQDPVTQVTGVVAIVDFRNTGLKFFLNTVTPSNLYTTFTLLQDCFPGRVKDKHIICGSPIVKASYNLAKLFMNAKMKKRIIFHGDKMSSLHKHIPPEVLPEEYGGTLQVDNSIWARKLLSKEDEFVDTLNYGFVNSSPT